MSSAGSRTFIPAVDDGWAILSEPPGLRDLVLPDHWRHSLERSRRRRDARRPAVAERGGVKMGVALAAMAMGGSISGAAGVEDAAAARTPAQSLDLSRGSTGPAVQALQRRLGIPADGIFGPQTARAVRRFQRANGIQSVGRVGPQTTAALGLAPSGKERRSSRVEPPTTGPATVRLSPTAAKTLQAALGVKIDGVLGPQTRGALKRYEGRQGLPADGRPDAQVLAALGVDPEATAPRAPAGDSAPEATAPAAGHPGPAAAVRRALAVTGAPYVSGGTGPTGFDCSGLMVYAFKKTGMDLPRTSFAQYGAGSRVKRSRIRAGDLVFFDTSGPGASHVGIATGPDTVVSATTHGVMEHAIGDAYWGSHYVGARRL